MCNQGPSITDITPCSPAEHITNINNNSLHNRSNRRKDCIGAPSAIKDRGKCQKFGKNFRELDYYKIQKEKSFAEI